MQPSINQFLQARQDLRHFVRANPEWYRYLTRNPNVIDEMEKQAKVFYGKTVHQRIDKLSSQVQLVSMLIQMAGSMKD